MGTPIYPQDPEFWELDFTNVKFKNSTVELQFYRCGTTILVNEISTGGRKSKLFEIKTQDALKGITSVSISITKICQTLNMLGKVVLTSFWYPKKELDLRNRNGNNVTLLEWNYVPNTRF